jgi:hypothetical protein
VAEHWFFDRFFYQKSLAHGYWVSTEGGFEGLKAFGKRGEDILALEEFIQKKSDGAVLGATTESSQTIAVFGDSYVWGTGVKEDQRFAHLLEEQLNRYQSTKVFVFATEGDNIVDQWRKYQAVKRTGANIDLYVFGVVHNDALLKKNSWHGNEGQEKIDQCEGETVWDVTEDWSQIDVEDEYPKRVKQSVLVGTKNACVILKLLPDFPRDKALYVDLDSLLTSNPDTLALGEIYKRAGLPVLSFEMIGPDLSSQQERLFVSKKERHPSALAHRLYAEEIVRVLMSDPRFGFLNDQ